MISCRPGNPPAYCIVEDDLELLTFVALPPKRDYKHEPRATIPGLYINFLNCKIHIKELTSWECSQVVRVLVSCTVPSPAPNKTRRGSARL